MVQNELRILTSRTNNVPNRGQHMVIGRKQEGKFRRQELYSAAIAYQGKWARTYGRIEARIQNSRRRPGLWPLFGRSGQTSIGRLATAERSTYGKHRAEPGTVHGTIHGPGIPSQMALAPPLTSPGRSSGCRCFSNLAIEWQTTASEWYVDGQQYSSRSREFASWRYLVSRTQFCC